MKIFLLATCLLIITKVKAIDINQVQLFKEYLEKCEKDSPLGKIQDVPSSLRPDVLFCAIKNTGYIDVNDYYAIEGIEKHCKSITIDPVQCQKIGFSCYQVSNLQSCTTNSTHGSKESGLKFIQCAVLHGMMGIIPI
ncbi:venom allergen 4-like [Linepithema humile]|uniref:venom allergen 4-like n=1 Tax=Linepithema humile TaxID=83485 RepID=UPI000623B47D|nr:PREDICTED: venom allergen 4-like [Linepithema humile]